MEPRLVCDNNTGFIQGTARTGDQKDDFKAVVQTCLVRGTTERLTSIAFCPSQGMVKYS